MNNTTILVTGRNETGVQNIVKQLDHTNQWNLISAITDEEAIEKFHRQNVEVVILTAEITGENKRKLHKIFTYQKADIIIISYQNENSRELNNSIKATLDRHKKDNRPVFSFTDDALKNASFNIITQ